MPKKWVAGRDHQFWSVRSFRFPVSWGGILWQSGQLAISGKKEKTAEYTRKINRCFIKEIQRYSFDQRVHFNSQTFFRKEGVIK